MSESTLHYTLYFQTRAQTLAWANEAQAMASLPLPEQAQSLQGLLGLPEGSRASVESASAAGLLAELVVLGPWNLQSGDGWPAGLADRGCKLFGCEWGQGAGGTGGQWFNGPKAVTRKQFEAAARKMDPLEEVRQLLEQRDHQGLVDLVQHHGLDPNTVVAHRPLIVHLMSRKETTNQSLLPTDAVLALLQAGARPDPLALVTRMPSFTMPVFPLLCAAHTFDSRLISALLEAGVDVNGTDDAGDTALHVLACSSAHLSETPERCLRAAQVLLDAGADVNAGGPERGSPLAQPCHQRLRDLLLAHGARIKWPAYALAQNTDEQQGKAVYMHDHARLDELLKQAPPGETLRMELMEHAVEYGNHHALERLWRSGDHALMPVDEACKKLLAESITLQPEMDLAMVRDLATRSQGVPIPGRDHPGWLSAANGSLCHPLYGRRRRPTLQMVQMLLDLGAPANPPAGTTGGALSMAISQGWIEAMVLLLAHGADPNYQMYYGGNALHEAVQWKYSDCIPPLLAAGADRERRDIQGKTALDNAISKRNRTAQKYLTA